MSRVVLLVIDGCAPAYLTRQTAPKLYRLSEQYGFVMRYAVCDQCKPCVHSVRQMAG